MQPKALAFAGSDVSHVTTLEHCFLIATAVSLLNKDVQGQHLPETIVVKPEEIVRLNCSTSSRSSADWHYRKTKQADSLSIYIGNSRGGGRISNSYKSRTRYAVYEDIASGIYDLIIRNVTKSDEGIYTCTDTSDPDIFTSTTLNVLEEEEKEECPYDEAAITGEFLQLRFRTAQSDAIHVEHRSTDRSYLLHVFRDGKIVNDYYVISGRFGFNRSEKTWNLLIKDTELSDSGTYILSEDNGLGKQYTKELVVIDKTVRFEIAGDKCMPNKVYGTNVTCAANFSGQWPPCLQLRLGFDGQEGKAKVLNNGVSVTSQRTVQLRTVVSGDDLELKSQLLCTVATPNSYIVLAYGNEFASYSDICKESNNTSLIIIVVFTSLVLLLIVITPLILKIVLKRLKDKKHQTSSAECAANQNLLVGNEEVQLKASPPEIKDPLT